MGRRVYKGISFKEDFYQEKADFVKWANPDPEFIRSLFQLIRKNQEKVKSLGLEFLREKMNFYNSRDFRLETALNLLERWDCISFNQKKYPEIIGEIPEDFLEEGLYTKRLKKQNEKLFDMLQYTKLEECRKQYIYKYFGIDHEPCGFCDNCEEG